MTGNLEAWRALAHTFHCISFQVSTGRLPQGFEPADLERLISQGVSRGEAGVMQFLLYAWDPEKHPFDAVEGTRGWDQHHRSALAAWVTGEGSGHPCRVFGPGGRS